MPFTFSIRFYEELNDFLPKKLRKKVIQHTCSGRPTIKDTIEALGIPHTEVDFILANGKSVDFDFKPSEGDYVSVYPVFESMDISQVTRLRPAPLREVRFVADVHLGKLSKNLRLLGFDTTYFNDLEDSEIIAISGSEKRIILTRDVQLLKNGRVTHGYFVRSVNPDTQTMEVVRRFDLFRLVKAFARCSECNGLIEGVKKEDVAHKLEPRTSASFDEFFRCVECERIYWKGGHYDMILRWISKIRQEGSTATD